MTAARIADARPAARRVPDRGAGPEVQRRPARASASGKSGAMHIAAAGIRAVARRPVPVLIGLAIVTVTASVGWNALMLQTSRHPAPLFGKPTQPVHRSEPAPLPVPRPAAQPTAPSPAIEPAPHAAAPDPIGAMIRSAEPARPADTQRIAAAQSALTKLGYGPLKSDGVIGPGTKQAVERFERERNLPVTGIVAGRTLKLLSQQAGIAID
jgi:hypothetical protein